MDLFILYLIGQADAIVGLVAIIAAPLSVVAIVAGAVGFIENSDRLKIVTRRCVFWAIGCGCFAALMPSKETLILMAAGKAVIEASKTDAAQSITSNSVKWLDGFVAEQAKKYEGGK